MNFFFPQNLTSCEIQILQSLRKKYKNKIFKVSELCLYEKKILWKFQKFENLILQCLWKKFEQKIFKFSELVWEKNCCKIPEVWEFSSSNSSKFHKFEKIIQTKSNSERERERSVCWAKCLCFWRNFASCVLKIPSATLIAKACFGGEKDPKIATLWGKKIWIRHILTKRYSMSQKYNTIPKLLNFFLGPVAKFG